MCGVEEDRLISVGTLPLDGRLFLDDDDDDDGGRGEAMGPWLAAGWCSRGSSELWWLLAAVACLSNLRWILVKNFSVIQDLCRMVADLRPCLLCSR